MNFMLDITKIFLQGNNDGKYQWKCESLENMFS